MVTNFHIHDANKHRNGVIRCADDFSGVFAVETGNDNEYTAFFTVYDNQGQNVNSHSGYAYYTSRPTPQTAIAEYYDVPINCVHVWEG